MKSMLLIAAGVTALFSGCASIPADPVANYDNVDLQKVAAVNNAARGHGITVHWIRYPELRKAPADVVPSVGEPTGS
ncbi:MAG: hypothetical protein ABI277_02675 [Burkholderiaceae bacterium]